MGAQEHGAQEHSVATSIPDVDVVNVEVVSYQRPPKISSDHGAGWKTLGVLLVASWVLRSTVGKC